MYHLLLTIWLWDQSQEVWLQLIRKVHVMIELLTQQKETFFFTDQTSFSPCWGHWRIQVNSCDEWVFMLFFVLQTLFSKCRRSFKHLSKSWTGYIFPCHKHQIFVAFLCEFKHCFASPFIVSFKTHLIAYGQSTWHTYDLIPKFLYTD